jgi:hypothetical protein
LGIVGFRAALSVLLLAGCGGDDRSSSPGSGASGISTDETGIASTAGTSGPKLDVGDGVDTEPGGGEAGTPKGCEQVDFLFVIDSSNSMATNQAELIASFPEFVSAIEGTLTNVHSYHVGGVTSDAYAWNEPGCTMMGALVTQTGGKDSGMQVCTPFASGMRYMTEADDLPTAFGCAALVGTGGANDEAMMAGATQAVSAPLNASGACNDGFLRDDALLVLVLITDEDDPGTCVSGGLSCEGSPGDPTSWFDEIVGVKGGHRENVVALSLTRGSPGNVCGSPQGTEMDGERIMQFVALFGENGLIGDICANSFGAFFDQAVDRIDSACGGFIPPVG